MAEAGDQGQGSAPQGQGHSACDCERVVVLMLRGKQPLADHTPVAQ